MTSTATQLTALAERIELWPIERLRPYECNPRTHRPDQISRIAASMVEFGWTNPILVDDASGILAGHGRLAARQLGLAEVPVIRLEHLSEAQKRAYVLADNQLALDAGWDESLLANELAWLRDMRFDLDLLGFDALELDRLLTPEYDQSDAGADVVPEPPADPVTRPGDLWLLSPHRLLCGDATRPADVARLLAGARPHLMVTDPPYGIGYDPAWRNQAGVSSTRRTGKVPNDHRADWREAWALFPGDVAYVWHAAVHARTVAASLEACGFEVRSQLIWAKPRFVLSRGHYHWQHEPCWYVVRKGAEARWQGGRDQSTLWELGTGATGEGATVHGTQKPVACMLRPMLNNSRRGDTVYEPFAGSGTSFVAAEKAGRICLGLELDPAYCDVIVERWRRFTGQAAQLDDEAEPVIAQRDASVLHCPGIAALNGPTPRAEP